MKVEASCTGCLSQIIAYITIFGIVGGICYPYAINSWLVYAHKEPSITFWTGFLIGIVPGMGQFALPAAAVTWILMLFC